MTMTDPIADMLTRVRNANTAGKETVSMPSSKKLVEIARIMDEEGYIVSYEIVEATHLHEPRRHDRPRRPQGRRRRRSHRLHLVGKEG